MPQRCTRKPTPRRELLKTAPIGHQWKSNLKLDLFDSVCTFPSSHSHAVEYYWKWPYVKGNLVLQQLERIYVLVEEKSIAKETRSCPTDLFLFFIVLLHPATRRNVEKPIFSNMAAWQRPSGARCSWPAQENREHFARKPHDGSSPTAPWSWQLYQQGWNQCGPGNDTNQRARSFTTAVFHHTELPLLDRRSTKCPGHPRSITAKLWHKSLMKYGRACERVKEGFTVHIQKIV